MKQHRRIRVCATVMGAVGVAMLSSGSVARAAIMAGTGFSIDIGSYAHVLDAIGTPQYDEILADASCDNPHLRIRANNKPAIKLSVYDTTTAGAELSSFSLQINSNSYFFGNGDLPADGFMDFIKETIYVDSGVSILGTTLSADMKTLTVNFDGMTAGKSAIFHVDLDVVNDPNMFLFPDYRVVLNGAPLTSSSPPTAPATISGTFSDNMGVLTQSKDLEQFTEPPDYFNQNIRPYHVMDNVPVTPENTEENLEADVTKLNFTNLTPNQMGMILGAAKVANTGDAGTLIDVLSYMFTGPDAALFKLKNPAVAPGDPLDIQLVGGAGPDMMTTFDFTFMGAPNPGMYTATFVLATSAGDVEVPVMAMVEIPEPRSALLAAAAAVIGLVWRRR